MKTLLAVFVGSTAAAMLAFAAMWVLSSFAVSPTLSSALHGGPGASLAVTALALIAGAFVAVKIHPSAETLSGYATVQLFFGPALIRDFWLGNAPWHAVAAILIVLPLTFFGALLGARKWVGSQLETL
jgi:hypothetical protein